MRKSYRFRLSAPAFYCWVAPSGTPESGDGVTRDIDTTGAYINAMELPPVGARVQMDIMLPNILGGEIGVHLTGEGVVRRVETNGGESPDASESGFEVSMQFYVESSESVLSHLKRSGRLM